MFTIYKLRYGVETFSIKSYIVLFKLWRKAVASRSERLRNSDSIYLHNVEFLSNELLGVIIASFMLMLDSHTSGVRDCGSHLSGVLHCSCGCSTVDNVDLGMHTAIGTGFVAKISSPKSLSGISSYKQIHISNVIMVKLSK